MMSASLKLTGRACPECGTPMTYGRIPLSFQTQGVAVTLEGVPAETCPLGHEPYLEADVFEALGAAITQLGEELSRSGASRALAS